MVLQLMLEQPQIYTEYNHCPGGSTQQQKHNQCSNHWWANCTQLRADPLLITPMHTFLWAGHLQYLSILPRHGHWWWSRLNPSGSVCSEVERLIGENDAGRDTEGRAPRRSGDAGLSLARFGSGERLRGRELNRGWDPWLMD